MYDDYQHELDYDAVSEAIADVHRMSDADLEDLQQLVNEEASRRAAAAEERSLFDLYVQASAHSADFSTVALYRALRYGFSEGFAGAWFTASTVLFLRLGLV